MILLEVLEEKKLIMLMGLLTQGPGVMCSTLF